MKVEISMVDDSHNSDTRGSVAFYEGNRAAWVYIEVSGSDRRVAVEAREFRRMCRVFAADESEE